MFSSLKFALEENYPLFSGFRLPASGGMTRGGNDDRHKIILRRDKLYS
jgi:hypothetical protein